MCLKEERVCRRKILQKEEFVEERVFAEGVCRGKFGHSKFPTHRRSKSGNFTTDTMVVSVMYFSVGFAIIIVASRSQL